MIRRWLPFCWTLVLSLLLLGPALAPGFVLQADMVFTPQQQLQPWMFGIDSGLPRAVPQDVIVSVLSGPIPGEWLQHIILLGTLLLAGTGVARLLQSLHLSAMLLGISFYLWNAYLIERLLMGNWAILLAYAVMPWLVGNLLKLMRSQGSWRQVAVIIAWSSLAVWVPSAGIMTLCLVAMLMLPQAKTSWRYRIATLAGVTLLNLPWLGTALLHTELTSTSSEGAQVFALHPEGPWPAWLSALSGGAGWNAGLLLGSRELGLGVITLLLVIPVVVVGYQRAQSILDFGVRGYLLALGAGGYLIAVLVSTGAGQWAIGQVPGGGLLRDAQKWLVFLMIFAVVPLAAGADTLVNKFAGRPRIRRAAWLIPLLPILLIPDASWGATGKLSATQYPASWYELRSVAGAGSEKIVSLPWSTFRKYDWNRDRIVVDPMPRFLFRPVVTDTFLRVAQADGRVITVVGDDPVAAEFAQLLNDGVPLAQATEAIGATGLVIQKDQPGVETMPSTTGFRLAWASQDLEYWQLPQTAVVADSPGVDPLRYLLFLLPLALVVVCLLALFLLRIRALLPDNEPNSES